MPLNRFAKSYHSAQNLQRVANCSNLAKKSRSILQNKIPHCVTFTKVTTLRVIQRTASTTLRSLVCAKVKMAANILVFKLHNRSPPFKHRLASSSHEHNFQQQLGCIEKSLDQDVLLSLKALWKWFLFCIFCFAANWWWLFSCHTVQLQLELTTVRI